MTVPEPVLADGSRPAGSAELLARLADLGIAARTVDHPPVFTAEEAARYKGNLPGAHTKKATSFLGPMLLGTAATAFHSQRAGVAAVLLFLVVGGLLLTTVNEPRGIAAAREG